MRYYIALAFVITDLILYYHAYIGHDQGVIPALTVLWWVSFALTIPFLVMDLLNVKIATVAISVLGIIGSAYVFFAGVLSFQQWALALNFWLSFGFLCLFALAGVAATAAQED